MINYESLNECKSLFLTEHSQNSKGMKPFRDKEALTASGVMQKSLFQDLSPPTYLSASIILNVIYLPSNCILDEPHLKMEWNKKFHFHE